MLKNKKYIKIKSPIAYLFLLLLTLTSIASGYLYANKGQVAGTKSSVKATSTLEVDKTNKPEFLFFVMSFCPYGNQIEQALKPVADLLGDKVNLQPQYIFNKFESLEALKNSCKQSYPDPSRCQDYVDGGQVASVAECEQIIGQQITACENGSINIDGVYYSSLHGRIEVNQNVREICAWNQTDDKSIWWNFIENVNTNCDTQNADTCWQDQAKQAGLDTDKITDCFNTQAKDLIEAEIAQTEKYQASASPTLILSGVNFPPETAYTQDGTGALDINGTVISQADFRTPEGLKQAICSVFSKQPKECKTTLETSSDVAAPSAGGC